MVTDLLHCDGQKCPCREKCARFQPFVPPDHPVHWLEKAPFEPDAGACPEFLLSPQQENQHATATA